MAAFSWDEIKSDWRIYDVFRHGPTTLFHDTSLLEDTIQYLESRDYFVPQIDCRTAKTESNFYNEILFALGILKSEYKNIKPIQFWDLVTEADFTDREGIVLAFKHFDAIHSLFPECAQDALNILAGYQYRWLWLGNRFKVLVQTDDPRLELKPLHEMKAAWNNQESSIKERTTARSMPK